MIKTSFIQLDQVIPRNLVGRRKEVFDFYEKTNGSLNQLTMEELAKLFNCSCKTLYTDFIFLNIDRPRSVAKPRVFNKQEVIKLCEEGYSSAQIAEMFNTTVRQVTVFKETHKIKTDKFGKVEINNIQQQVIIGSLLGDGCMGVKNQKYEYCALTIKHSIKQKDYIQYKRELLGKLAYDVTIKTRPAGGFNKTEYEVCTLDSLTHKIFKPYRIEWYPTGIKIVPKQVWELEALGLAIWLMDDGYFGAGSCHFCTNGFDAGSVLRLGKLLEKKFNLKVTYQERSGKEQFIIRVSKESLNTLKDLVRPFLIKSMMYKIGE